MITKAIEIWALLCQFAENAGDFFMQRTCDVVYDIMVATKVWPAYQFAQGGFAEAFEALEKTFGTGSLLSFCLVTGVVFILGYKLVSWLIDILP